MKEYIYIDGKKINDSMPLRTLFYGEGVFESFRYRSKPPVLFDKHMKRMEKGAALLKIPLPKKEYIKELVNKAILNSELSDAYVKICLLSSGKSAFYEAASSSQVLVIIKEYTPPNPFVRLKVNSFMVTSDSPLRAVKSMNYLDYTMARREAIHLDFDEALLLNEREEIVECSVSNIFWFKDKTLYTPSEECGCLPGTTRDLVMHVADSCDMQIQKSRFLLKDMITAEFVFVANSLIGCVPVSEVDGSSFITNHESFNAIKSALLQKLEWL